MPHKPSLSGRLLLILFLLLLNPSTWALPAVYNFDNISTREGLTNQWVLTVLQDKQGFIWAGTHDGLFRYDGYTFKTFKHNPLDDNSLAQNIVYTLFEDASNTLWIGTQGGVLHKYNALTETFVRFAQDKDQPTSNKSRITSIAQGKQNDLWIATFGGGVSHFDIASQSFTHNYRHIADDVTSLSDNQINVVLVDAFDHLWAGANSGGLNRLDRTTGTFKRYQHHPHDPNSLSHNRVHTLFEDKKHQLWIGTLGGGLNHFNRQTESFTHFRHDPNTPDSLASDQIQSIFEDKSGGLWLGTNNGGLNRLDKTRNRFERYLHDPKDKFSLADNDIFAIAQDQSGLLWLGTFGGGISKFDPTSQRFGLVKHNPSNPNSLIKGDVDAIFVSKSGIIWVGTQSGLNRYDPVAAQYQHYQHNPKDPHSLSDNHVRAIFEDSTGTLWVGTQNGGLNQFNQQNNRFIHYKHQANDPQSLSDNYVKVIHEGNLGNLWVGTINGLSLFNPQSNTFNHYPYSADSDGSISSNNIYYLYTALDGHLWVATLDGGINQFHHETQTFVRYQHDPANSNSLSHNTVYSIAQDSHGIFWLGTAGGLNRFDSKTKVFSHYREKDGLSSDIVYAVMTDEQDNVWLGGSDIALFDPLTNSIKNNIGAQANCSTYDGAFFQTQDGQIFFGNEHGYCTFYPQNAIQSSQPPLIAFTDFRLLNKSVTTHTQKLPSVLSQVINYTKSFTLDYTDNVLSFEFAALHYANSKLNQYQYKLEGFNQDWIETDANNRHATYTNLPAGDYNFKVKASNSEGIWNKQGRTIKLTILPAPWRTWWAYTFYALIVIFLMLAYVRAQHRKIRFEQDISHKLEQQVAQRTADLQQSRDEVNGLMNLKNRMFANISHEFKTPLTLILTPLETLLDQPTTRQSVKLSMIKRNANRLLWLIDQFLALSRLRGDEALAKQHYSLKAMLNVLLASFKPLIINKNQSLNCQPFNDVTLLLCVDSLEIILTNLISNAIKYTPDNGTIDITVLSDSQTVTVSVKDNGIGITSQNQSSVFNRFTRDKEQYDTTIPGSGIGLALVKELVESQSGTIALQSEVNQGSTFTITLPQVLTTDNPVESTSTLTDSTQNEIDAMLAVASQVISTAPEPTDSTDQTTILLIDDNADMLTLLVDTLQSRYHCLCAPDGEKGVALANEQLPDLVISDVMMPGIDGYEVVTRLKESDITSHIPVILLTAKGDRKSRIKGWVHKADEFLHKPFNTTELLIRVDNLLAIRSLLSQRYQRQLCVPEASQIAQVDGNKSQTAQNTPHQQFLTQLNLVLEKHYRDEQFDVNRLASDMALSTRQLNRKMKMLLDLKAVDAIRSYRLKEAAKQLLKEETVGNVAAQVGFTSHSYFSQCFKAQFNCLPSQYLEESQ